METVNASLKSRRVSVFPRSTTMSYHHYTPQATGTTQPTASYPYGAYTAYGYQTGYQWPYPYGYSVTPQQTPARPPTTASPAPVSTPAVASPAVQTQAPRPSTFTAYTPSYAPRESAPSTSTGRSGKKQSNIKGLFNKECTWNLISLWQIEG